MHSIHRFNRFLLGLGSAILLMGANWNCTGRGGKTGPAADSVSGIARTVPDKEELARLDSTRADSARAARAYADSAAVSNARFVMIYNNEDTGKHKNIVLPDGTTIKMSHETTIRITKAFNKTNREVQLDGEAVFSVKNQAGLPFFLYTKNLQIQVLGTRFRVDAYAKFAGEEVDVLSGKLKVRKSYHSTTDNEPELLQAGEMVMINRDIDLMEKEKVDSTELRTWDIWKE
ncbi:FecR family protein [Flavitalea flava]